MTDPGAKSPFDLEDDSPPPAESSEILSEVAAAPAPTRARRERPARRRREPAAEVPEAGASERSGVSAFLWGLFTSPRWLYGLTSLLSAALLFILFNPEFGMQDNAWFWDVLMGKGSVYAHAWNPSFLQAVIIPLFTLAFAAAALSGEGVGRPLWAGVWVLLAFLTFQIARDELRYFLPPIVGAVALGLVIRRAREGRARQASLVVLIILTAFLFMPLPRAKPTEAGVDIGPSGYRCAAFGLVDLMIEAPGDPDDGAIVRRAKLLLLESPQYLTLLAWVLLVLSLMGFRGRWTGYACGGLLLAFLIAYTWLHFDIGHARGESPSDSFPAWWRAARQVADAWRARFLVFLPALVGVCIEIGRLRRAR